MKKTLYGIVTILTICLMLIMSGCSKKEATSLTIGLLPNLDSIPIILAKEKGYLDENINLEFFKSAVDRDTALQTGNIDGTASDLLSVIFLKDNNFDVLVTSATQGSFAIVTSPKLSSSSSTKTIAISTNTIIEYLTDIYMEKNNINLEKVAIPKMPTRLEMLQNNQVNMATLPEPLATACLLNGGVYSTTSEELGTNPAVMIFTKEATNNKSNLLSKFYEGYNEAVDYINTTDKEEYIDIVMEKGNFPAPTKDTLPLPQYKHAYLPDENELTLVNNWMIEKELTENEYIYKDITTDKFIK
ncbi:MAG: ABC transporter substrate-binding protein [Vallitalea sp.]|nr:ABC transporter substrate-binding protein [Vallitalea sp.]